MTHDLIERYLYAVTKRLNPKMREDVAEELRGLIDDMLAERCGSSTPNEKDIRIVLTELGSPEELYQKYDTDSRKCLIGQPYYSTYKLVLKIVMLCAAFGLTMAGGILWLLEPLPWYEALGRWLSILWNGLLGAFALITALFAIFYRYGVKLGSPLNFDELPPVPKKRQEIPRGESIFGIAFSIVFLIAFLTVPQVFGIFYGESGQWIPLFQREAIQGSWLLVALFSLAGIVREIVKLLEKRYNTRVVIVTLISDGLSALFGILWLTGANLINPEFQEKMAALFQEDAQILGTVMMHFQYFFLGVMLFALVIDAITTIIKAYQK